MELQIPEKNTIWFKKVKNGLWRVFRGNKKISEHSTEDGAKRACTKLLKPL